MNLTKGQFLNPFAV